MHARPARLRLLGSLIPLLVSGSLFAQDVPVRNWEVPAAEVAKLGGSAVGLPAPFSAISPPCRLYDSRVSSGGPGPIPGSGTRAFDFIPAGSPACGSLPSNVVALSLYITVVHPLGPGFIYAFPTGNVPATPTSIINYNGTPGELRNNAAILAVNPGDGSLTIGTGGAGTDIIIDINGVFYSVLEGADFFEITGNRAGGVVNGVNVSTAANTYGVTGTVGSQAGVSSAGVFGAALGSAPVAVFGGEFQTDSTATGSAGVLANSDALTGTVYGLLADNDSDSTMSAAVWGRSGSNTAGVVLPGTIGLIGSSFDGGGTLDIGVVGVARGPSAFGIFGARVTTSVQASGVVGYTGTSGLHSFHDITAEGVKSFIEPHPTDPALEIAYVSLEGREAGTYFRGRAKIQNGIARFPVPEDFRLVSEETGLSIQAMPIGEMATFAVVRIDLNEIVVKGSRNVEFFYTVNGVRKGHADFRAIRKNEYFRPASSEDTMKEWSPETRARLVANGTLTPEGRPNLETAERLGWKTEWEKQAAQAQAIAKARRQEETSKGGTR